MRRKLNCKTLSRWLLAKLASQRDSNNQKRVRNWLNRIDKRFRQSMCKLNSQ